MRCRRGADGSTGPASDQGGYLLLSPTGRDGPPSVTRSAAAAGADVRDRHRARGPRRRRSAAPAARCGTGFVETTLDLDVEAARVKARAHLVLASLWAKLGEVDTAPRTGNLRGTSSPGWRPRSRAPQRSTSTTTAPRRTSSLPPLVRPGWNSDQEHRYRAEERPGSLKRKPERLDSLSNASIE
jgi:hypothetical protein